MKITRRENKEYKTNVRIDFEISLPEIADILLDMLSISDETPKDDIKEQLKATFGTKGSIDAAVKTFLFASGHPSKYTYSYKGMFESQEALEQAQSIARMHIKVVKELVFMSPGAKW